MAADLKTHRGRVDGLHGGDFRHDRSTQIIRGAVAAAMGNDTWGGHHPGEMSTSLGLNWWKELVSVDN